TRPLMTSKGEPFSIGAVLDARTGRVMAAPLTSLPVRQNGGGILALTSLKFNPDLPPPPLGPGINPAAMSAYDKQQLLERWVLRATDLDREAIRKERAAEEAGRPPARARDRTGVVAATPRPPPAWAPPPPPPALPEGLVGAYNVPNTPPLFGDTQVGFLSRYVPAEDPKYSEKLRHEARAVNKEANAKLEAAVKAAPGFHWRRYDLRTGRPTGDLVRLGPVPPAFDPAKTPVAAAMTHDGGRLAPGGPAHPARGG